MIVIHDSSPKTEARFIESYGERITHNDQTRWHIAIALYTNKISKSKIEQPKSSRLITKSLGWFSGVMHAKV